MDKAKDMLANGLDVPPSRIATSTCDELSIAGVMAECRKIGSDPQRVLAEAFTPDVIDKIGRRMATRFALDLVRLSQGDKVTFDGNIDTGHTRLDVSEVESILAAIAIAPTPGDREEPG
jgi:hypothetical protein